VTPRRLAARIAARVAGSLVWPMIRKEFLQIRRDRLTLAMLVVVPAMYLVLFGYAVRSEVRHVPTVVLDDSRTPESRRLVETLGQTQNFRILGHVGGRAELAARIGRGDARAAIVIPPDFARAVKRGEPARAQVIVDAADPMQSAAALAGAQLAARALPAKLDAGTDVPAIDVRVRPWYNPALRSSTYIVPGICGLLLTISLAVVMAMAIVKERETGTLEQLVVTPVSKSALMLGKIVPFVAIGYVQLTNVLVLGKLFFDVPLRGSLVTLYAVSGLFIAANLGVGLLISAVSRTQNQAQQLATLMLIPSMLLSGFVFPREAMPPVARWVGAAIPLTYYLDVTRGILLRGVGLEALWRDVVVLAAMAAGTIALSVRRFSKTVD
jgi:ABC-2 type transport system permease protein